MKNLPDYKKTIEYILSGLIAVIVINVLFVFLPTFWSELLIGKSKLEFIVTFQDVMWIVFTFGLLQLRELLKDLKHLQVFFDNNYLPEDFETIIDDAHLTKIIKLSKLDADKHMAMLPYMILQICLQFRANNSIALSSDFLSKQIESFLHTVELRYNQLKYIIWLIPSLGFMGTVYGIGVAVSDLGKGNLEDPALLTKMAGSLGIAFNTTLLALVLSVILQYITQKNEATEERQINRYGKYILDNLINRLVEK